MKSALQLLVSCGVLAVSSVNAFAISQQVKIACRSDYFAYCSQHSVGSPALRQCMREHAKQLSRGCKDALIASGEAGKSYVARRAGN
jgi:hypothetical protein